MKGDFPQWSGVLHRFNAHDALENQGLPLSERQVQRIARTYPGLCMSGGIEAYLERRQVPLGGVSIGDAAITLCKSRTTVYRMIRDEELTVIQWGRRRYVVLEMRRLPSPPRRAARAAGTRCARSAQRGSVGGVRRSLAQASRRRLVAANRPMPPMSSASEGSGTTSPRISPPG